MAQPNTEKIRYAVVGDSYSCGEGAKPSESWPAIMTQHLKAQGVDVDLVSNPSVTGWTTKDAIDKELPKFIRSNPTFASLLIGVNDWPFLMSWFTAHTICNCPPCGMACRPLRQMFKST